VHIGDYFIDLATYPRLRAGDRIVVVQPTTPSWLETVQYGGAFEQPWSSRSFRPMQFYRIVKGVYNKRIELDAPMTVHLDLSSAQSYIIPLPNAKWINIVEEVGIEDLAIDIQTMGDSDENHFW
jgi:hypothetical protein